MLTSMEGLRSWIVVSAGLGVIFSCGGAVATSSVSDGGHGGSASNTDITDSGGDGIEASALGDGASTDALGQIPCNGTAGAPYCEPPHGCCQVSTEVEGGPPLRPDYSNSYVCVEGLAACDGQYSSCTSSANCTSGMICCRESAAGGVVTDRSAQLCESACSPTGQQLCQEDSECLDGGTCAIPGGYCLASGG